MSHARFVLTLRQVGTQNVVPSRHLVAAIDGHRHHRRIGKDETDRANRRQVKLFSNGHKITSVSPQAVQDQNSSDRVFAGLGFNDFE